MLSPAQLAAREQLRSLGPSELAKLLQDPKKRKQIEDFEADCAIDDYASFVRLALSGVREPPPKGAPKDWEATKLTAQSTDWDVPSLAMDRRLRWAPFMDIICKALENLYRGEYYYLLINVPPGFMKSMLTAVLWQAWVWLRDPAVTVMSVSAVIEVSYRDSRKLRALIQCEGYRKLVARGAERFNYPVWTLSREQNEKANFITSAGGQRIGAAYGAPPTGLRLGFGILDDPIPANVFTKSPDQVNSACAEVELLWREVFSTRFQRGVVQIAQRLGLRDLAQYWLDHEKGVHVVCLPLLYDPEHPYVHPDDKRKPGEILSVDTLMISHGKGMSTPEEAIAALEATLNESAPGQLQQMPVARGGTLFRREWFNKRYSAPPDVMATMCDEIVLSADLAVTDKARSDFTSITIWGRRSSPLGFYLLARFSVKMEFVGQFGLIKQIRSSLPRCDVCLVDERQAGRAMVQLLAAEIPGVVGFKDHSRSKTDRAEQTLPLWESGNVYLPLPEHAPWLEEYIRQHLAFPKGKHDDDVDSTAQALLRWKGIGIEDAGDAKATLDALVLAYDGFLGGQGRQ